MIACNADGAVVIVGRVFMVMRNCHEGGKKEEQYKEKCKTFVVAHGYSFKHEHKLAYADQIVNKSFAFSEWALFG